MTLTQSTFRFLLVSLLTTPLFGALGKISPLLKTSWGQEGNLGLWNQFTPKIKGNKTLLGCGTVSTAQVLFYYKYKGKYSKFNHDYQNMALSETEDKEKVANTARFMVDVANSINVEFKVKEGTPAVAKNIENAFLDRKKWGFPKRYDKKIYKLNRYASKMLFSSVSDLKIMKNGVLENVTLEEYLKYELDRGRPVLYVGSNKKGDGHSFVIDGYKNDNTFHVNWGWGGFNNGFVDSSFSDHKNRKWNVNGMVLKFLEPLEGEGVKISGLKNPKDSPQTSNSIINYKWSGSGSIISQSSKSYKGYGLTQDLLKVSAKGSKNKVVFFQWEIDSKDGTKLEINSTKYKTATVTYGIWNSRQKDRTYQKVELPFILDPKKDGNKVTNGTFYTIALTFNESLTQDAFISAKVTKKKTDSKKSVQAIPFTVDGHTWNGNSSIISKTSKDLKGYGLTKDLAMIHSVSSHNPAVFAQWEVDQKDGKKLTISSEKDQMNLAKITYGNWDSREKDITVNTYLPYTLDINPRDGSYYVIKVEFPDKATSQAAGIKFEVKP